MQSLIRNKSKLIKIIEVLNAFTWLVVLVFGIWTAQGINTGFIYEIGKLSGQIAAVLFCLVILPGIARRIKFRASFVTLLMIVRRQLGIAMFSVSFLHYSSIRLFPILFAGVTLNLSPPIFEIFGVLTLFPLFFLFITSNNFAVKSLKSWWGRIHKIVYISVWALFLHIALQEIGIWTIVIGLFAAMETLSLCYYYGQKSTSS